ncbi:MAG: helix-turn-helix transcriptional regulator [Clostridia bacterium]|jgi:transcriptional regulator with XRE-family HTH domain|nr:helix-turn-helix transcriptional regulator [Clostridia bacterium]
MDSVYSRIEALCKRDKVTVTELCRACGIPRATLSDYKMGRSKSLSASTLSKISAYFSVSVEYLLEGESAKVSEDELKVALFGGAKVTDAMWEEIKRYAQYIKDRENGA